MKCPVDDKTIDAFNPPAPKPFVGIRNQRPSVDEQKATLCMQLGRLCNKPPESVLFGSIDQVLAWKSVMFECREVLNKTTSTVPQLESAINRMKAFK